MITTRHVPNARVLLMFWKLSKTLSEMEIWTWGRSKRREQVGLRSRSFQHRCLKSSLIHIDDLSTDQARQDTLDWLDDQTIMVINDWAMKLFPICFRERQSQWFAKCGSSWHLSAVVHKSNHPDCPVVFTSEHLIPICDYHWQLQTGLVFCFLYTWRCPCLCQRVASISM